MRPAFLADADFNCKIVTGLRRREPTLDFLSATDSGVHGMADIDVLGIAASFGRVLVSHDRKTMPGHFTRFNAAKSSAGLIIVSQKLDIASAIEDLLLIWAITDAEEWIDRVGYVPI